MDKHWKIEKGATALMRSPFAQVIGMRSVDARKVTEIVLDAIEEAEAFMTSREENS